VVLATRGSRETAGPGCYDAVAIARAAGFRMLVMGRIRQARLSLNRSAPHAALMLNQGTLASCRGARGRFGHGGVARRNASVATSAGRRSGPRFAAGVSARLLPAC